MAVNESVYGSKANWTDVSDGSQWGSYTGDGWLSEYYPHHKIGYAGTNIGSSGQGTLGAYLKSGAMTRDDFIDSSPAWVYTSIMGDAIGWEQPTDGNWRNFSSSNYNIIGSWTGAEGSLTPIMCEIKGSDTVYGGTAQAHNLQGYDSYYCTDSDKTNDIFNVQAKFRFSPSPNPSSGDMASATIVANQTERYALTELEVNDLVYQQDTTDMWRVKNASSLSTSSGYELLYSLCGFDAQGHKPLVSFCPKNIFLVPKIILNAFNVMDNDTKRIPTSIPTILTSQTVTLADITDEFLEQNFDTIEAWKNRVSSNTTVHFVATKVSCDVYARTGHDRFQAVGNFGFLLNGGVNVFGGDTIIDYRGHAGVCVGCRSDSASGGGTVNVMATYNKSSNYTDNTALWWGSNASNIPLLLNFGDGSDGDYLCWTSSGSNPAVRIVSQGIEITSTNSATLRDKICRMVAKYGLFFCDKASLIDLESPTMWADPHMHCGTYVVENGKRVTYGDYTTGMDNINQPQFKMIEGITGETWNATRTFSTEDDYPQILSWNLQSFEEPTPYCIFDTEGQYPQMPTWRKILIGAFALAENLTATFIPNSTKLIGYNAYRQSSITEADIANDCDYYEQSFPDECTVHGGHLIPLKRYNRYTSKTNESSSTASLTTTINCAVGDLIVATFAVRNATYGIGEDWTLLGVSEAIGSSNQITGMAYKIATSTTESLVLTQGASARCYCNLVAITGASVGTFSGFTTQTTGYSITAPKPNGLVLWGVSSVTWSTSSTAPKWSSDVSGNSMSMVQSNSSNQPRLLTALDQSESETVTFTAGTTGTANLACASLTINGLSDFWYFA